MLQKKRAQLQDEQRLLNAFCSAGSSRFKKAVRESLTAWFDLHFTDTPPSKEALKKSRTAPPVNKQLLTITEIILEGALLLGRFHAKAPRTSFADDDLQIIRSREAVPFEQAIDFLKGTVPMHKGEWEALEKPLRFRAFTVARLAELDHIEKVRQTLVTSLEKGEGFAEKWATLRQTLQTRGEDIAPCYFETVYRTNVQTAYNAGRLMQYQNNPPHAWELLVIEDGRTSDTCKGIASLIGNGKALPADHPFWKKYGFPPYHFNCRTTFRAVYDTDTAVQNVPLGKLQDTLHIQNGFGGNPIEKESWWRITDTMKERIVKYGIADEVDACAHQVGLKNYDFSLASEKTEKRELGHTGYKATIIKGAEPKQHEIAIAEQLEKHGYKIIFTPENQFIQGIKNPEGIETTRNKIVEMKKVDSQKLDKIGKRVAEAAQQNPEIAILNLEGEKPYTKQQAVEAARKALHEEKTPDTLQEVWLLWKDEVIRVKK